MLTFKFKALKNKIEQELINHTLWIPVFMGAGIVIAFHSYEIIEQYNHLRNNITLTIIIILLLFITILINILNKKRLITDDNHLKTTQLITVITNLIISMIIGALLMINQMQEASKHPTIKKKYIYINIRGTINKIEELGNKKRVTLTKVKIHRLKDQNTPYKVRLSLSNKHLPNKSHINIGDKISLMATIYPPNRPVVVGGYNFQEIAFFEKIGAIGYSNSPIKIINKAANNSNTNSWWLNVQQARQLIKETFHRYMSNNNSAGVATALVTGDRSGIPPELRQKYVDAGIAHILAISGLHMALVAGLVFFLLRTMMCFFPKISLDYNTKKIAAFITIIITFGYLLLCWEAVPARRSFIMAAIVLLSVILDRHAITIRNVMFAALVIMIINPHTIMGVSFLLSFAAVIALISFYNYSYPKILKLENDNGNGNGYGYIRHRIRKLIKLVTGLVITSIIATIATAPFSLYFFKQLTLCGIIANIIAIPMVSFLVMPLVLLSVICMPLGSILQRLSITPLEMSLDLLNSVADYFASYSWGVIYVQQPTELSLGLAIIGFILIFLLQTNLRVIGIIPFAFGLYLLTNSQSPDFYYYVSDSGAEYKGFHDKSKDILYIASKRKNSFITDVWRKNAGMPKVKHVKVLNINYFDTFLRDNIIRKGLKTPISAWRKLKLNNTPNNKKKHDSKNLSNNNSNNSSNIKNSINNIRNDIYKIEIASLPKKSYHGYG